MSSVSSLFVLKRGTRVAMLWLGAGFLAASAQAGTNVGVSVNVNQPGFYGRVDIGDQPPPAVLYPQPVIIQQGPVTSVRHPIYLRVPPEHSRNWARYCGRYNACGQPVYFVRDDDHDMGHGRPDRRDVRHAPPPPPRPPHDRGHDRHDDHGPDRDHGPDHDH